MNAANTNTLLASAVALSLACLGCRTEYGGPDTDLDGPETQSEGADPDTTSDLGRALRVDVTAMSKIPQVLAANADELTAANLTGDSACYATFGDCAWCFEHEHTSTGGTFDGAPEMTPCGITIGGDYFSLSYQLEAGELSGSWTNTGDGIDIELTAHRSASLTITGPRRQRTREAQLDVHSLSASIGFADGVRSWSADFTFQGLGGRTWLGDVSYDGEVLSGVVEGENILCTLSGTASDPVVSCE